MDEVEVYIHILGIHQDRFYRLSHSPGDLDERREEDYTPNSQNTRPIVLHTRVDNP